MICDRSNENKIIDRTYFGRCLNFIEEQTS